MGDTIQLDFCNSFDTAYNIFPIGFLSGEQKLDCKAVQKEQLLKVYCET